MRSDPPDNGSLASLLVIHGPGSSSFFSVGRAGL